MKMWEHWKVIDELKALFLAMLMAKTFSICNMVQRSILLQWVYQEITKLSCLFLSTWSPLSLMRNHLRVGPSCLKRVGPSITLLLSIVVLSSVSKIVYYAGYLGSCMEKRKHILVISVCFNYNWKAMEFWTHCNARNNFKFFKIVTNVFINVKKMFQT